MSKNRNRPYEQNQTTGDTVEPSETSEVTETTTVDQDTTTTAAPVVEEKEVVVKETPVEITQPVKAESTVQPKSEGYKPVYKIELELNNYAEAMDPKKPINPEEGGRWQYSLFSVLKSILNSANQEEFNKEWNTVLGYFNKNKDGLFNEKFIFRFPEQWTGSSTEFTMFRRLVFTIIQTANPKNRKKALSEINMSLVTEGMTEPQKNKLLAYYGM